MLRAALNQLKEVGTTAAATAGSSLVAYSTYCVGSSMYEFFKSPSEENSSAAEQEEKKDNNLGY